MRFRRAALVAVLALLAGCTGPAVAPLAPLSSDAPGSGGTAGETLVTVLSDLSARFTTRGEQPTQVVSADSTVQVAAEELTAALDLGDQAHAFVLAAGFELQREAAQASPLGRVESVNTEVIDDVPYTSDGTEVELVTVRQEIHRETGPITEVEAQFAVSWDGRVSSIQAVIGTAVLSLDRGVDLTTPRGAVHRFLDLVRDRDYEAIRRLSRDANATATLLDVLASLLGAARGIEVVTLPQARNDGMHTVYAVNDGGSVIARFDVTVGELIPTVVYFPTA